MKTLLSDVYHRTRLGRPPAPECRPFHHATDPGMAAELYPRPVLGFHRIYGSSGKGLAMNRFLLTLSAIAVSATAHAQAPMPVAGAKATLMFPGAGHFFVALVAGILLATVFHLVLTNLAVGAGLRPLRTVSPSEQERREHESRGMTHFVRRLSSGFGIWTLITASIALFFGSWLAVRVSPATNVVTGLVVGVVIWGLFYLTVLSIQTAALSTLAGSLVSIASTGLRSAYHSTVAMFGRPPEERMAETSSRVTQSVRDELFEDIDFQNMCDDLRRLSARLAPARPDPAYIHYELSHLLDEPELRAVAESEGPLVDHESILSILRGRPGMSRHDAEWHANAVYEALDMVRDDVRFGRGVSARVSESVMPSVGISRGEGGPFRKRIEDYLRSTRKEELRPESIRGSIERLVSEPRVGSEELRAHLAQIDRSSIAAVLAERPDMTEQEAQRVVDRIDQVFQRIISGAQPVVAPEVRERAIDKIRTYVGSMVQPELRYEHVLADVRRLLSDPRIEAERLVRRLKRLDHDALKGIYGTYTAIPEGQVQQLVTKIEEMRDDILRKSELMRSEVEHRLESTRQDLMREWDEARKIAAAAAWWAFVTVIVSGIASALGGYVAVGLM